MHRITPLILLSLLPILPFFVSQKNFVFAAEQPLVKIVSPTDGQTIVGQEITVSFILGNLAFGSEAHLHLWLDTDTPTASTATELSSHLDHIISGAPPGPHTLTLEAVRPNHQSFTPPVVDVSHFTLQAPTIISNIPTPTPTADNLSPFAKLPVIPTTIALVIIVAGVVTYLTGKQKQ